MAVAEKRISKAEERGAFINIPRKICANIRPGPRKIRIVCNGQEITAYMNRWFRVFLGRGFFKERNLREGTLIKMMWINPDTLRVEVKGPPPPFLQRAQERMKLAEQWASGYPSIAIECGAHDAILFVLQQKVADVLGMNSLIKLRKERKLSLGELLKELAKAGIELDDELKKELDTLRDLRNRIVHEGFRASKGDAEWALTVAKKLITSLYPDISHKIIHEKRE